MSDVTPWRERNLQRVAEARRILEAARARAKDEQRDDPIWVPVMGDLSATRSGTPPPAPNQGETVD